MRVRTHTIEQTIALGRALGEVVDAGACIVLCGDLGAGKTQFTKGVAAGLGSDDAVTSPTFTIVAEYLTGRLPLFHFDLYRLDDPSDLIDIGYDDLLEAGGVCVMEWGDRFPEMLPEEHLTVSFTLVDDRERMLECIPSDARTQVLVDALQEAAHALGLEVDQPSEGV
ncbi:MAG: tRNA (adenosine(37)-N6)-threonylcarbamoyltransferase complex ATPase subunit type 1 TsaE [Coriobacteriales bacterium]|jgi:tRNA threonylcarbamoyladenosine biosynthesis protein TsaE|nr:tRNA (adenosine(37)-N6)-threonylcarbamoyltransferase complex ATPase subunit type 1 TsaE [Coriobacteriales bacterium]